MTFKSKKVIQDIIDNDGNLEGEQVCSVWQYDSQNDERLYSVFMNDSHDMWDSPYVYNPILLWANDLGKVRDTQ